MNASSFARNSTRNKDFNRLYGSIEKDRKSAPEAHEHFNASEFFRKKMREGNLIAPSYVSMAGFLLNDNDRQADREQVLMGKYCLEKAVELSPHDTSVLAGLVQLKEVLGDEENLPALRRALSFLNSNNHSGGKLKIGIRYLANSDHERAAYYFRQSCDMDGTDVEAFSLLSDLYLSTGNFSEASALFSRLESQYPPDHPFCSFFWGRYGRAEFLQHNYDKADWCLKQCRAHSGPAPPENLAAEIRNRLGDPEGAISMWAASLKSDPLQVPLYLKMHDTANGLPSLKAASLSDYNINILVYTFNKHDMFKATMEGLAKTEIGGARILILDNHCTDATAGFLKTVQGLFPDNPVRVISLPVNIGAPAARNWLLAQPENDQTDFVAYLDDDVLMPADWLKRLVATLQHVPSAGVAGAKVVNRSCPPTIQYIYRFLDFVQETRLVLSSKHPDELDFGQFNFMRKCLSVMGCCHLLRTDIARQVGEFDIRFSPSQVDDIDHDIMTCLKGHEIIYNGYLDVIHCQKSGKEAFVSRPSLGNILGNDCKFAMKHTPQEIYRLKEHTESLDRLDIRNKVDELKKQGYLQGIREVPFDVL